MDRKIYVPYNILPLDPDSRNQTIMTYPEIQAAVYALRNTCSLPWPKNYKKKRDEDILDWLQAMFGFQKDSVANQREHLILLLANVHIRQFPEPDQPQLDYRALSEEFEKLFENYKKWCKDLDHQCSLWLSTIRGEVQQHKLLYMGLYLLIWGEAADLRFMPECLCYIYHHMAFEVDDLLVDKVSPTTGKNMKPTYGGEEDAFLKKVVTPIYQVIKREAERSRSGKSKHDDLNEYFRSVDCFQLGWPMRADADFFVSPVDQLRLDMSGDNKPTRDRWAGKINFVVIGSFWHIFRSFHRIWSFFILCLATYLDAIFSTICGGNFGAFRRLGEIRTLGMLKSRFQSLPCAFNARLIPGLKNKLGKKKGLKATLSHNFKEFTWLMDKDAARFAQLWNKIITSFREEDLISNREMDLLLVPYWADHELDVIQWPPVLLASKIPIAMDMTNDTNDDQELTRRIEADNYMSCAVSECYKSFHNIIMSLVRGDREKGIIEYIFSIVEKHIAAGDLIIEFDLSALPRLYYLFLKLIKFLLEDKHRVVKLLQKMLEVVTGDILLKDDMKRISAKFYPEGRTPIDQQYQLFTADGAIEFPVSESEAWKEKIRRLYLLLTAKESAMDVPSNLEARRRLSFFSNSLFMDMPCAPKVRNMLSFSVLTPLYTEEVLYSLRDHDVLTEDGVSILFNLQKIFPDEWKNFLERVKCNNEKELKGSYDLEEQLLLWASYRGHTLTKTVRSMMYYRKALELQAFLDMAKDEDLMDGYKAFEINEDKMKGERSLWTQCQALADMKFTYVVSCQQYGILKSNENIRYLLKRSRDARSQDIIRLMTTYPSIRVAYIEEVEEANNKVYYSSLVKAEMPKSRALYQVIYRIKLPGPPMLGDGKPENQNHAIIFTRGEGLQTMDLNQDNYMEEALKMRNLLQEFLKKPDGEQYPTIVGLGEHIYTGRGGRYDYGHPDVFDRLFHLTRGFNSTHREGNVTHHKYIQVGKGVRGKN